MSSTVPFGRRAPAGLARTVVRTPAPAEAAPSALSPEAEAFRRALAGGAAQPSEFERWRRDRRLGRWTAWSLSFALTLPGMLCFVANAPASVSAGVEVTGLVLGFCLRRARRRRLAEVAAWEPDPLD